MLWSASFAIVRVALNDVFGGYFSTEGIGQLEIDGDVVATTRTYTRNASGGTLGEAIAPEAGSTSGLLDPVLNNDKFRTNIGFAETAGTGGTIYVRLGYLPPRAYTITPFGHFQIPVSGNGAFSIQFDSTTPVAAYASTIDNATGDATLIRADHGTGEFALAPIINAAGAFGTMWTTRVWLVGAGRVTALDNTNGMPYAALTANVPTIIDFPIVRGVMSTNVVYRTPIIANDGYRESAAFIVPSSASQDIPLVENSPAFRTNVGLMSDGITTVRMTLFDAAGNAIASSVHDVVPMVLDQFPITASVTDGRVHIDVLSGRVAAYASVVDNITGDASFVPAQ